MQQIMVFTSLLAQHFWKNVGSACLSPFEEIPEIELIFCAMVFEIVK